MRPIQIACIFVLAGLMITVPVGSGKAQQPSYLILRAPVASHPHHGHHSRHGHHSHHGHHGHYPGYGFGVQTQAYSYGWFGARPRAHHSRHFGYYRNYTEWSAR